MTIILNEGDCVGQNDTITINLAECRRTVKSDGQVIYETGDMNIRSASPAGPPVNVSSSSVGGVVGLITGGRGRASQRVRIEA